MQPQDIQHMAQEVAQQMKEQLSIRRGRDLRAKLRRTGILMPKRVKREAGYLADAAKLVENPKLFKMVDQTRVKFAHRLCLEYLRDVDPYERRKGMLLSSLGGLAFGLLGLFGIVIGVLVWQGYL